LQLQSERQALDGRGAQDQDVSLGDFGPATCGGKEGEELAVIGEAGLLVLESELDSIQCMA